MSFRPTTTRHETPKLAPNSTWTSTMSRTKSAPMLFRAPLIRSEQLQRPLYARVIYQQPQPISTAGADSSVKRLCAGA